MKIILCSRMFPDVENDVKRSVRPNPVSGHKFQEDLLSGLIENGYEVFNVNASRVRSYPDYPQVIFRKKRFQRENGVHGVHVGFINLFGLNYLTQSLNIFLCLRHEIRQHKDEQYVLVTFNSYVQICVAMLLIKLLYPRTVLCDVVGDLHGSYGVTNTRKGLRGVLFNCTHNIQDRLARKFDSYAFVTKYMAQVLQAEKKPYVVIEAIYNNKDQLLLRQEDTDEKIIFYAGAVRADYGIPHLLRTFSLIEDPNYHMQLAGGGDSEDMVRDYAAKDPRIEFLGFITPQEVEQRQQAATVLISPRTSEHEYVKYSFPSKTMECLASGKPYIAHRLPCDPPEYAAHIQYAADETDEALRDKIVEICELPAEERKRIGQQAREFILNEKNPTVMCRRIVDMWENVLKLSIEKESKNRGQTEK